MADLSRSTGAQSERAIDPSQPVGGRPGSELRTNEAIGSDTGPVPYVSGTTVATSRPRKSLFDRGVLGLLAILIGAWAGIVAYVGPSFGYSADGSGSWEWTLQHTVLHLVPGAAAVLAGLLTAAHGGRSTSRLAGFLLLLCGAWLVLGPSAWPALNSTEGVFAPASPVRSFLNQLGYNLGPGLILVALGGMSLRPGLRRQRVGTQSGPFAVPS